MARQTRQQRRERRAQQAQPQAPQRDGARMRPARATAAPAPAVGDLARRVPGGGLMQFFRESAAELKKVDWPNQQQVLQATVVVLIACIIVGFYLYLNDEVWKRVVHWLVRV